MPYQKKLMTINELVEIGFSKADLKQWVHAKDFPYFKTNKMWKINTDLLDAWLIKVGYMPKPSDKLIEINEMLKGRVEDDDKFKRTGATNA